MDLCKSETLRHRSDVIEEIRQLTKAGQRLAEEAEARGERRVASILRNTSLLIAAALRRE
jgi:hypothetical protein